MFYIEDYLPAFMFGALAILLFSGFPVGFVLGGVGLAFGFIGVALDVFHVIQFFNLPLRIWGIADNLVLVAIPCSSSWARCWSDPASPPICSIAYRSCCGGRREGSRSRSR